MFMKNGEKINRSWLIYSKAMDSILCFCRRLFGDGNRPTQLSSSGFNNWKNLQANLKAHERSPEHIAHMDSWHTLDNRLKSGTVIGQVRQHLINAEILRWKEILHRLLAIVNHLAERNLPFRGQN